MTDIDIRVGDVISIEHTGIIVDGLEVVSSGIGHVGPAVKLGNRHYSLEALGDAGWKVIKNHRRFHAIPTKPGVYRDRDGRLWTREVEGWRTGESVIFKEGGVQQFAPFTALVPEGSEREQAIRDVLSYIDDYGWMPGQARIFDYGRSARILKHFGVTT